MRNPLERVTVVAVLILCLTVSAAAQIEGGRSLSFSNIGLGFGARAMALGGAFIAIADDITAINYNPAGLAQLLKPEFSVGLIYGGYTVNIPWADLSAVMAPDYDYYYSSSARMEAHGSDFSYVGGVFPFKIARLPAAVGFAAQVKGSNINPESRYAYVDSFGETAGGTSYHTEQFITRNIGRSGTTQAYTVSLALRPLDTLQIGFNLNYWAGKEHNVDSWQSTYERYAEGLHVGTDARLYETDGRYRISDGISGDVGLLLKLKTVSLGVVYKSSFHADYSSDVAWTDIWNSGPPTDGSISSKGQIYWPRAFGAGIAVRPLDLLTLSMDYTSTQWSGGSIDTDSGDEPGDYPIDDPQDTYQIRAGLEYILTVNRTIVPLRAGWFRDRLLWNDVDGDPVRFTGLTVGTGMVFKSLIVDVSAIYHFGSYLSDVSDLDKTHRSSWDLFGSLTYRFSK